MDGLLEIDDELLAIERDFSPFVPARSTSSVAVAPNPTLHPPPRPSRAPLRTPVTVREAKAAGLGAALVLAAIVITSLVARRW